MSISAGRLDTLCAFQSLTEVPDGGGGSITNWTTRFTVWGGFTFPRLGSRMEAVAAGAVQATTRGELIVRRGKATTALIDAKWRVVAKGRTWNIGEPLPDQRDGFVRMPIESGVPT